MRKQISPLDLYSHLVWLDGRPLLKVLPPYMQRILMTSLYTFGPDGLPMYNLAIYGAGKKNFKTLCLLLAAIYCFMVRESVQGNDSILLANDEDQADDDLSLAKKLFAKNPILADEVHIRKKLIERRDGKGAMEVKPGKDVIGMHGGTWGYRGIDEFHGARDYSVLEASSPDPTRTDALTWIASYASIYNTPGAPLFDLVQRGKRGDDPRMYFAWYAADYTTDPDLQGEHITSEQRANPAMSMWTNENYLADQKMRLPNHRYRRLHLNLPGMPDGTYFDAERVHACKVEGRLALAPLPDIQYHAFADMSGGSSDDATLGIAHTDPVTNRGVLDIVIGQTGSPPFNPRDAVKKFAGVCKQYRVHHVTGDRYAGETFRADFSEHGISYTPCPLTKHELYEALEPRINAAEVDLLDIQKLDEQLLGLVTRGAKIDHLPGEHDDWINAAAGAIYLTARGMSIDASNFATADSLVSIAEIRGSTDGLLRQGYDV